MKKATLTFVEMKETFELFEKEELSGIKGGLAAPPIEWREDENGNLYYRNGSGDSWHEYSITLADFNFSASGSSSYGSVGGSGGGGGFGSPGGSEGSGATGGGGNSQITYPLQSSLFYNSSNNTFNLSLNTLADYWGDHYLQMVFTALGTASSQSSVSDFANNISFSKSSLARAAFNNLFIKVLTQNLGGSITPHASGPTTLTIANHGDNLTNLGIYVQTVSNNLYQELQLNGVLSIDASTGNVINVDLQKFAEYQNSVDFQNFINRNVRYQDIE